MIISEFRGQWQFLSNFYHVEFMGEDAVTYPTMEHYFQAHKIRSQGANTGRVRFVRDNPSPRDAKRAGRRLSLPLGWDHLRLDVMAHGLACKFEPESREARRLLRTGTALLVEGNSWHDQFWGRCYCGDCDPDEGKNWLGRLLMLQRAMLQYFDEHGATEVD